MKRLLLLVFFVIMASVANADTPEPCLPQEAVLERNAIDLDTKTIKGWVRILNNKSKQGQYGIKLTKKETEDLIRCLTIELNNRKGTGKLR